MAEKMQYISLFISPVDSSTGPGGQGTEMGGKGTGLSPLGQRSH